MKLRHVWLLGILASLLVLSGCSAGFLGIGGRDARPANVAVHIISQSCFEGEVEPCG